MFDDDEETLDLLLDLERRPAGRGKRGKYRKKDSLSLQGLQQVFPADNFLRFMRYDLQSCKLFFLEFKLTFLLIDLIQLASCQF